MTVNIKEKVMQGHIHAKAIIQLVGKPKEHIEQTMKEYIEDIKKDVSLTFIHEEIEEAIEKEKDLWANFAEIEFLAKDFMSLSKFCFDFMPASIEIMAPDSLEIEIGVMQDYFNELQSKIHQIDFALRQANIHNKVLSKNLMASLKNNILMLLINSPRKLEEISKFIGLDEKVLTTYLEDLQKEGKIKKEGDVYLLENVAKTG